MFAAFRWPQVEVSWNRGTPKSSILVGSSLTKTKHIWYLHDYGNSQVAQGSLPTRLLDPPRPAAQLLGHRRERHLQYVRHHLGRVPRAKRTPRGPQRGPQGTPGDQDLVRTVADVKISRFPRMGIAPKSSIYRWIVHYKPEILGYPHVWKPPCMVLDIDWIDEKYDLLICCIFLLDAVGMFQAGWCVAVFVCHDMGVS